MSDINPIFNDRVQYTLSNKLLGTVVITEPIGWNDDEKEYSRHQRYHGFVAVFSNSSKYIKDAADFINLVYQVDGINGEIELVRKEKHPKTDVWTLTYSGYLDLSTWGNENNQVSIKFNSRGLEMDLKARETEKVEIDRTESISGSVISELEPITVNLDGRRIFLKTKYGVNKSDDTIKLSNASDDGNKRGSTAPAPIDIISKSHEKALKPIENTVVGNSTGNFGDGSGRAGNGETGLMFFAVNDKYRELKIKFKINFKVNITRWDDVHNYRFWARLVTYKDGADYTFKEGTVLFTRNSYNQLNGNDFVITFDDVVPLDEGESLGLVFDHCAELGSFLHDGHVDTEVKINSVDYMDIEENSFHKKSTAKAILAHELMDRLVSINTSSNNSFYSEYFGRTELGYTQDGPGAFVGFTHGFWVRGFDKFPLSTDEAPNLYKPLSTSFKDAFESVNAVFPIGVAFENIRQKQRIRIEELSYFYNNNVTIRLPNQVKNLKRSIATEYYYSTLELGYEKGGDYEEAMGLDEFNAKSNFSTIISRISNPYIQISKYRADSYGMEFARRKPKSLNDTEDTSYDDDIFWLDLKRGVSSFFDQRKWQDDFEKAPTGIFSPETATNLRLSPVNSMLRHGWWIGGGFKRNLIDYVRYGSSTANSQLKTQLIGKNEYAENGNILNSELDKNRFFPEWIEFEHECDFDIMSMVEGTSLILGKQVPNFYGLVEFTNEYNEKEKGFLFNLKPNGRGKWKILKAYR